jgi:hypothetical protein
MASFFISLLGGAYCLVEEESIDAIANTLDKYATADFVDFTRPDGKTALINPRNVTLIQPPAPASFKHTDTKEN